jgi:hypothetical protein
MDHALRLSLVQSIRDVPRDDWNRCALNDVKGLQDVSDSGYEADATDQLKSKKSHEIKTLKKGLDSKHSYDPARLTQTDSKREQAESFREPTESVCEQTESSHEELESIPQEQAINPFISHEFLSALETAGCVGGRTGWSPVHLLAHDASGALVGCAPSYLKAHSQGEYVFDHGWALAYEQAGGRYYPKLQVASPFSPVTGPRLLAAPGAQAQEVRKALANGLLALEGKLGASSTHMTFLTEREALELEAQGWMLRFGEQFQFVNAGYRDYDDFLDALASRKRKALKRERREALAGGVEIERLTGAAITETHWDAFFAFYMDTGSRKWGRPYLNRRFFSLLGEAMADRILLVMGKKGARYVAGALNLIGPDALYGRYWGAIEEAPFLHFELCYHQAIDYALANGLARVEAGAQGEHKLARGYLPQLTYSAHHITDPALAEPVDRYLRSERAQILQMIEDYDQLSPFKKSPES